jgi:protein-S-isoprenylcysteine O-methyltransferase Ste14
MESGPSVPRLAVLAVVAAALLLAILFVPAGRLDWWEGWTYFALTMGPAPALAAVVLRRNPELAALRLRAGKGTPRWDPVLVFLLKVAFLGGIGFCAWDAGRHGPALPVWTVPVGGVLILTGIALLGWSMAVNRHFETTVRIQEERAHRVIDTGPYAFLRHPGYAAAMLLAAGTPAVLRSAWAFLPLAASAGVLVVRILLEERLLRHGLPGYEEYTRRVRHRLVPGVW